eukprot:768758-Hanusia_phi.AAC.6
MERRRYDAFHQVVTSQTAEHNIARRTALFVSMSRASWVLVSWFLLSSITGAHALEDEDDQDHGLVDKRSHAMSTRNTGAASMSKHDKKED